MDDLYIHLESVCVCALGRPDVWRMFISVVRSGLRTDTGQEDNRPKPLLMKMMAQCYLRTDRDSMCHTWWDRQATSCSNPDGKHSIVYSIATIFMMDETILILVLKPGLYFCVKCCTSVTESSLSRRRASPSSPAAWNIFKVSVTPSRGDGDGKGCDWSSNKIISAITFPGLTWHLIYFLH